MRVVTMHQNALFFISPALLSLNPSDLSSGNVCHRRARMRVFKTCSLRMTVAPLPDDTAPDMLSFALSGPGWIAGAAFILTLSALLYSFAEIGHRRGRAGDGARYILRITSSNTNVESVRRYGTREEALFAISALNERDVYSLYEVSASGMKLLKDGTARESLGSASSVVQDEIDREWKNVVSNLSPIRFVNSNVDVCKLCNGKGRKRCARCFGARAKATSAFKCVCDVDGFEPCEWCAGTGEARV